WWHEVYLQVDVLEPGGKGGVGKTVKLLTKGWLPYKLRWQLRVTETDFPKGSAIEATGDFVGTGRWTYREDGDFCNITYDWRIQAEKPFLRYFSFVLKPIFKWNHKWAMGKGEANLPGELERRRQLQADQSSSS
ncbi:MAG: polyketide cyclase, partial [Phaeodactylibacter sp.]|nr:polyketide cyclase [Phaeodactylibacter sp.]